MARAAVWVLYDGRPWESGTGQRLAAVWRVEWRRRRPSVLTSDDWQPEEEGQGRMVQVEGLMEGRDLQEFRRH